MRGRGRVGLRRPRKAQHPADVDLIRVGDPTLVQHLDLRPSIRVAQMPQRQFGESVPALHRHEGDRIGDREVGAGHQRREGVRAQGGVGGRDLPPLRAFAVIVLREAPQVIARRHTVQHCRAGGGCVRGGGSQRFDRGSRGCRVGGHDGHGRRGGVSRGLDGGERDRQESCREGTGHAESDQSEAGTPAGQADDHLDHECTRPPGPGSPGGCGQRDEYGAHIGQAPQADRGDVGDADAQQGQRRAHGEQEQAGDGQEPTHHHRFPR